MDPDRATPAEEPWKVLLYNCTVIGMDQDFHEHPNKDVLIQDHHISVIMDSVGLDAARSKSNLVLDCSGLFLIPGLCDAHVHVTAVTANLHDLTKIPTSLVTARSMKLLEGMLMRGFTTVRDAGGCDWGLAKAVEEGLIKGPRILFSGRALSQTGGHGDFRSAGEENLPCCPCSAGTANLGRVCDGVTEVRRAARDELRKGAHQIKIMASGGVSSPTDRIRNLQFSEEEIRAIVEEATNAGTYVCAHAYTAPAVLRCLELGVRSIEHGNYINEECIKLLVEKDAFLVPTLVTYDQIVQRGKDAGMPANQVEKVGLLLEDGRRALSLADKNGVNICYGSDLLGVMHDQQLKEFSIRGAVQSPRAVLRSATWNCARLFNMEQQIGLVSVGRLADLVLLQMNPLQDISVLSDPDNIQMVMKQGQIVLTKSLLEGRFNPGRVRQEPDFEIAL